MPEWIIERGIGETRAALIERGEIIEARIELDDSLPAGSNITARLADVGVNGRNAIAIGEGGQEFLLPAGASGTTQGASVAVEIAREAIPGIEPWKRSLARLSDQQPRAVASIAERLGGRLLVFPGPRDELGEAGWDDLIEEARSGGASFAGGALRISPTPAMTLIDVDGYLPPDELAVLGAREAARAIRRLDLGGSVGVDLPTVRGRAARQLADQALDEALPQPFERTAVNGFGFVQIVRPRYRASLVELAADLPSFEARALLRRAAFAGAGSRRLVAHPKVVATIEAQAGWLEALSRQIGGAIELRADPSLPISGGYAENL